MGPAHRLNRDPAPSGLVILVAVAFVLRLGYCAAMGDLGLSPEQRYREYVIAAQRLVERGTFESPLIQPPGDGRPSCLLPPAYVGVVACFYRLFGVESFVATLILQILNAVASSAAVVFVFLIARRLGGQRAGWAAFLLGTVNPLLVSFTAYIWDTNLFALGVTMALWLTLRLSDERPSGRRCFGFGLFLGGLALLNPALTLAYPLLVLWMLSRPGSLSLRRFAAGVGLSVLGWLLAMAPWTVRNYVQFHELVYVRGALGLELWLGVCPEADRDGSRIYQRWFPLNNRHEQMCIARLGERAYTKRRGEMAVAAIRADPGRWTRLIAVRAVDFWAGTVFTHVAPGQSWWPKSRRRAATMLFLFGEAILILIATLVRGLRVNGAGWMLAVVILFSGAYCLTHVQVRYRAPIEPVIVVLVAVVLLGPHVLGRTQHRTGHGHARSG